MIEDYKDCRQALKEVYVILENTNLNDLSKIPQNFNNPRYKNTFIRLIAATLFLFGGTLYLYQEINYDETNEIGFI